MFFLFSCSQEKKKGMKVKLIGVVNSSLTINTDLNYENENNFEIVFKNSDTSKFIEIEKLLSGDSSTFIMNDSVIIRNLLYEVNGQNLCCKRDTSNYFIENINDINYLLLTWGPGYLVMQIENGYNIKTKSRENIKIPTWNLDYNSVLNENLFKDSISVYESSYSLMNDVSKNIYSIYLANRELNLITLKFLDTNERVTTQIGKNISENELNEFIEYMKTYHPLISKEEIDLDNNKVIYFKKDGFYVYVTENKSTNNKTFSDWDLDKYNFRYSDFYTLSKTLINRIGKKYKLIDYNHSIINQNN